ncbi:hypothetical protein EPO15_14790 [bacterium]|nr:MAG: hypothetical protein EPO15_14790 [bacterium]
MGAVLLRFGLLAAIKVLSRLCYRFEVEWVGRPPAEPFADARIGVLLNHTSLFEPILSGVFPFAWLWAVARRGVMPGADSTLDRPVAGRLIKSLVPKAVSVTRARDRTWAEFLSHVGEEDVVLISPEGRMKRRDGLDKHGKPMTLRGGIVDVLERKREGTLLLVYSEGLHHVQAPGEGFPRLFKRVRARLEEVPIALYKAEMGHGTPEFRANVLADLERRRDRHCPWD